MGSACRTVLALGALGAVSWTLSACDGVSTSIAQGMSERAAIARAARIEAQGNPQFPDPELQAIVADFERQYAVYGTDSAKLGLAEGTPCPMPPKAAFRALRGVDYDAYTSSAAEALKSVPGYTAATDLDSIRTVVLDGTCDASGPAGPAVLAGTMRSVTRIAGEGFTTVTVTDEVIRVDGTWADGERVGPFRDISITQSAQFKPGADGVLEEDIKDWDYLNRIVEAPTASYLYVTYADGRPTGATVSFARNPVVGTYTTSVTEPTGPTRAYSRTYQGAELISEGGIKDGRPHGWQIIHPTVYDGTPIPGQRNCYQDGELIKALECPST